MPGSRSQSYRPLSAFLKFLFWAGVLTLACIEVVFPSFIASVFQRLSLEIRPMLRGPILYGGQGLATDASILGAMSVALLGTFAAFVWTSIDASRERVFILLTNRTHDHSLPFANINSVRREFHSLASKALA